MEKEKRICEFAYKRTEICGLSGEVNFCCSSFTKNYKHLGSLHKKSFKEIWNGRLAQKIRQSMIDGNFKYCKTDICCSNEELLIPAPQDITPIAPMPEIVEIAPSFSCNVRCIMCRDKNILDPIEVKDTDFYTRMHSKYLEILKDAKYLNLNKNGEALASEPCKKLFKDALKINPKLKIGLLTNGLRCTEKVLKDYGIIDNLYWVQCSIHAATKETYDKIVRGSNFEKIKENMKWIAEQKAKGRIERVTMNFVVMSYNYKEIPDFIKWAQALDVECDFWEVRKYAVDRCEMYKDENFRKVAVFEPEHPEYNNLVEVLQSPLLKLPHVHINDFLMNLKPIKKD